MKVFLIYVRDEDFYRLLPPELAGSRSGNGRSGNGRFGDGRVQVMAFPPIGIETLAPVVRQHGHEVRMFDTCHPQMKEEHIAEAVREERPDVIALSFLSTTSYPAVHSMARRLKRADPDTPIILGGVFATMNARKVLADCPYADCIGVGEGEELLPDYIANLDDPGRVAGLVWRSGEEIVENAPRPIIKDLDQFPYPDRQSLPIDYIESMPLDVPAVLSLDRFCTMQTSRGCPYPCVYCDIPALADGKWRCRSPEHVLGEMQELNDQGYRSIYLTDDHFLLKRKRIREICEGIIERKLEFRWGCEGRVDSVAVDQFPIMVRQLQLPRLRHRGGHPEGAGAAEEDADNRADRARGQRGQAPRHRYRARVLSRRLTGRERGRHPAELPLRGPAQARHLRFQPALRVPRHAAVAGVCGARHHR